MKRRMVAACTRSLPERIVWTPDRSRPAMSSSVVRRAASSNAKFGTAVKTRVFLAISCTHRAGRCKNDIGLIRTECRPMVSAPVMPSSRPMSW
jgi:hypothetical protein